MIWSDGDNDVSTLHADHHLRSANSSMTALASSGWLQNSFESCSPSSLVIRARSGMVPFCHAFMNSLPIATACWLRYFTVTPEISRLVYSLVVSRLFGILLPSMFSCAFVECLCHVTLLLMFAVRMQKDRERSRRLSLLVYRIVSLVYHHFTGKYRKSQILRPQSCQGSWTHRHHSSNKLKPTAIVRPTEISLQSTTYLARGMAST